MKLFEPGKIGKMTLKNRIVMAPMGNNLEESDGKWSQRAIDYYVARARGGVGLIVTGGMYINRTTVGGLAPLVRLPALDHKMFVARLSEIAEGVHDYGAKLSVQLHVRQVGIGAPGVAGPSAVPFFPEPGTMTRAMSVEEIERLLKAYRAAARFAKDAGADCIDIHGHKGGLVDQFMSAYWNKRTDQYGGDLERRLRFAVEIIRGVKQTVGADFPVIFRYGLTHYMPGGREIEEGLEVARRLEAAGADALLIDAGCMETSDWIHPPTTFPPGCMVDLAHKVRQVVKIPILAVGKLGYPEVAERVLQEGKADFISLGRPLLADPEWANKVKAGRPQDIRPCIGCNEGCEWGREKGREITCTVNPATGRETDFALEPAAKKKSVLVVGGGPGGLEAALVSALRGHKVTLWEKADVLGGNLIPAAAPAFKQDYRRLIDYLIRQVKQLGVTIELGKEATPELVRAMNPDVVFVATGSTSIVPDVPGVEKGEWVTAVDLLSGRKEAGESVLLVGGGMAGSETALHLAQKGKKVTIVEMLDDVARDMYVDNRMHVMGLLAEAGVEILTDTRVLKITDKSVTVADKQGRQSTLKADTVVLAVGFKSNGKLSEALAEKVPELYTIGDCVQPRKVANAIREAYRAARLI